MLGTIHHKNRSRQRETAMTTDILDEVIPLRGASHSDVIHYGVDTPMRYSECYAVLGDGRIVRLRNARQFVGWTGMNGSRRLLFANGDRQIELRRAAQRGFEINPPKSGSKYVTRDGGLHYAI
jgi:hypothetical protein